MNTQLIYMHSIILATSSSLPCDVMKTPPFFDENDILIFAQYLHFSSTHIKRQYNI